METGNTPYSNIKIFANGDRLRKVMDGERTAPVYIRIKPTNRCNHNCYYCHYKSPYLDLDEYNSSDEIPKEKMMELISDMKDMGVNAVTFSGGGEPLLYTYIEEAVEAVTRAGIDLSIITNGSLLEGRKAALLAKARWVRISQESAASETYSKIRGTGQDAFKLLCNNIQNFVKIKDKNCELGINFVIGPENYKEVYQAGKLMKELGASHIKYTALISNRVNDMHASFKDDVVKQIHKLIEEEKSSNFKVINMYESDFDQRAVFGRNYDFCGIKDFVTVVAANSKIYYCHDKAYLSTGRIGDISERSFKDVWFSDEVTKRFAEFNPKEICRHHCVYDDRNNLLNTFYNLDSNHINFI